MPTGDSTTPARRQPQPGANRATTAYVALGSNLGDRTAHMKHAVRLLAAEPRIDVLRVSSLYETSPVGGPPDQGKYLNTAVAISTIMSPEELLQYAHQIERQIGRKRTIINAPRTIDVDLLLYGHQTSDRGSLKLPHPRMHLRRFVLVPLAEIAPDALHPAARRSVRDLLNALAADIADNQETVDPVCDPGWLDSLTAHHSHDHP